MLVSKNNLFLGFLGALVFTSAFVWGMDVTLERPTDLHEDTIKILIKINGKDKEYLIEKRHARLSAALKGLMHGQGERTSLWPASGTALPMAEDEGIPLQIDREIWEIIQSHLPILYSISSDNDLDTEKQELRKDIVRDLEQLDVNKLIALLDRVNYLNIETYLPILIEVAGRADLRTVNVNEMMALPRSLWNKLLQSQLVRELGPRPCTELLVRSLDPHYCLLGEFYAKKKLPPVLTNGKILRVWQKGVKSLCFTAEGGDFSRRHYDCMLNPDSGKIVWHGERAVSYRNGYPAECAVRRYEKHGWVIDAQNNCQGNNDVVLLSCKSGKMATFQGHTERVTSVYIVSETLFLSTGADNTLRIWPIELVNDEAQHAEESLSVTLKKPIVCQGYQELLMSACVSEDGKRLVTGSEGGNIHVWDLTMGSLLSECIGHEKGVTGMAMTENGALIVSGSYDNTVCLWDSSTGTLLARGTGHTGEVLSVCLLDENRVASGSADSTVRIWNGHLNFLRCLGAIQRTKAEALWTYIQGIGKKRQQGVAVLAEECWQKIEEIVKSDAQ